MILVWSNLRGNSFLLFSSLCATMFIVFPAVAERLFYETFWPSVIIVKHFADVSLWFGIVVAAHLFVLFSVLYFNVPFRAHVHQILCVTRLHCIQLLFLRQCWIFLLTGILFHFETSAISFQRIYCRSASYIIYHRTTYLIFFFASFQLASILDPHRG